MSDTRMLLTKIAALRQRLEQTPGRLPETVPVSPAQERIRRLESRVAAGSGHGALLEGSIRQVADPAGAGNEATALPSRLTALRPPSAGRGTRSSPPVTRAGRQLRGGGTGR